VNDILILPTGPLAEASLALAPLSESQPIVDHSIRSFLLARLLADHEGCLTDVEYDEDLLFAATVMHDLGLGEYAQGQARFEVEGADLAAGVLRKQGVAEADVDKVWEAIALHACIGIADRRGLLTYLTHRGVFMDIGRTEDPVASQLREEVFNAYPRPLEIAPSPTRSSSTRLGPRRPRLAGHSPPNSFASIAKRAAPSDPSRRSSILQGRTGPRPGSTTAIQLGIPGMQAKAARTFARPLEDPPASTR
jgi:hypothetical protein